MQRTRLWGKASAMALTFVLAMGLTFGFAAEKILAASISLNVSSNHNNGRVSVSYNYYGNNSSDYPSSVRVYLEPESGSYGNDDSGNIASSSHFDSSDNRTYGEYTFYNVPTGYYTVRIEAYNSYSGEVYDWDDIYVDGDDDWDDDWGDGNISRPYETSGSTSTNPVFTADITGGVYYYDYGFLYSTSNNPQSAYNNGYRIDAQSSSNSRKITSIDADSKLSSGQYYIWAYYVDDYNDLEFSDPLSFNFKGGAPVVRTISASTSGAAYGEIIASGEITNRGNSNVHEYGFVYSNSNKDPRLGSSQHSGKDVVGTSTNNTYQGISHSFRPTSGSTQSTQTFYVRAYATNNQGTGYGSVITVSGVPVNTITVNLGTLTPATGTSINAEISVSGVKADDIYEWGVAWSETNSSPVATSGSSYQRADTPASNTSATVLMEGLKPNTKYYVRAYARTSASSLTYSATKDITTQLAMNLTNYDAMMLDYNQFTLSGNLDTQGNDSAVAEKGFVYSMSNQLPTEKDSIAKHNSLSSGQYSVDVAYLAPNRTYYYRAYARLNGGGYQFAPTANTFTTGENTVTLGISYRDAAGYEVGAQELGLAIGMRITYRSLTIPPGYRLLDQNWSYSVIGNQTITVYVESDGTVPPVNPPTTPTQPGGTPPSSGPAVPYGPESVYMSGIGGGMFGPDNPGTVFEVASMLYNVLADPNQIYSSPILYPDVDYSYPITANIVNFVSSAGYMSGNENGLFRPNAPITRAEVSMIICHVKGLLDTWNMVMPAPNTSYIIDVPVNWATNWINLAYFDGVFSGYPDGTFRPNNNVTKAELASIFGNAFGRSLIPLGYTDFLDVPSTHWAYSYIMNAAVPN